MGSFEIVTGLIYFCFTFLLSFRKLSSNQPPYQLESNLKPTESLAFSSAPGGSFVFNLTSFWFVLTFVLFNRLFLRSSNITFELWGRLFTRGLAKTMV